MDNVYAFSRHLVVFGAGYVGALVAQQGLARGLRVTALTRNPVKAAVLAESGAEVIIADLASADWHTRLPNGADLVLNCVSSGGGGPEAYRHSYVEGMKSVLRWATQGPVGSLVYTSSTSVYPQGGGARLDESASIEESRREGNPLVEAEDRLLAAGLRGFVLRLAGIYGPERHYLLDQLRLGCGEIAGQGEHRLNLIHRDDIAGAIWAAFSAPEAVTGGVFNVADDGAAPKAELAAFLAAKLGQPVPHFTGQPAVGRRRTTPDRVIANDKIKHVLGWRPQYPTYREGYARYFDSAG
jgi:nucleoside-diphosphate-sugar epimerase